MQLVLLLEQVRSQSILVKSLSVYACQQLIAFFNYRGVMVFPLEFVGER